MIDDSTSPISSVRPRTRSDAAVRTYGDEIVAWSPDAASPVLLDAVSALTFRLFDGTAPLAELATDVHEIVGVPHAVALSRLTRTYEMLADAALLDGQQPPEDSVTVFPGPPNP